MPASIGSTMTVTVEVSENLVISLAPVVVLPGVYGDASVSVISQLIREGITNQVPSEDAIYSALLSKITGDGTNKITVSATEPTSPSEGDIWFVTP